MVFGSPNMMWAEALDSDTWALLELPLSAAPLLPKFWERERWKEALQKVRNSIGGREAG